MQVYTPVINLIVGEDDWELVDYPIAPPLFNKLPGRPKKKWIPSQGENGNPTPPTPTEGKLPKTGVTMTCKLYGQQGHNRVGCPITKAKKAAEAILEPNNGTLVVGRSPLLKLGLCFAVSTCRRHKTHHTDSDLKKKSMLLQSCVPSSVEVGNQDVCVSVLRSYKLQKISLHKSCGVDDDSIQLCKLCGQSESVLNLLLCDRCEEAFHASCCKPRVVLPIDEWFCRSCAKMSELSSFTISRSIGQGIGPCQYELGPVLSPIAAMIKYPEPFKSKVRIGEAYQARVPDWAPLNEVKTDNGDCSDADTQMKSHTASRKRKQDFSS
ncbi:hypothetical protein ACLB2K_052373 [Fragaria x ananassa]